MQGQPGLKYEPSSVVPLIKMSQEERETAITATGASSPSSRSFVHPAALMNDPVRMNNHSLHQDVMRTKISLLIAPLEATFELRSTTLKIASLTIASA